MEHLAERFRLRPKADAMGMDDVRIPGVAIGGQFHDEEEVRVPFLHGGPQLLHVPDLARTHRQGGLGVRVLLRKTDIGRNAAHLVEDNALRAQILHQAELPQQMVDPALSGRARDAEVLVAHHVQERALAASAVAFAVLVAPDVAGHDAVTLLPVILRSRVNELALGVEDSSAASLPDPRQSVFQGLVPPRASSVSYSGYRLSKPCFTHPKRSVGGFRLFAPRRRWRAGRHRWMKCGRSVPSATAESSRVAAQPVRRIGLCHPGTRPRPVGAGGLVPVAPV